MKEIKIYVEDNGNRDYEDTDILLEQLNEEYDEPRPVILQLYDIEGQIISGRCNLIAGTLEDGSFYWLETLMMCYLLRMKCLLKSNISKQD